MSDYYYEIFLRKLIYLRINYKQNRTDGKLSHIFYFINKNSLNKMKIINNYISNFVLNLFIQK